ncbi:11084_t:CDS:2, partial [Acaulospora colombiana]
STNNDNFHNRVDNVCGLSEVGLLNTGLTGVGLRAKWISEDGYYWGKLEKDVELELPCWIKRYFMETTFLITTANPYTRREEIDGKPDEELAPDMLKMFLALDTSRDITKGVTDGLNYQPMSDVEISLNLIEIITAGIDT